MNHLSGGTRQGQASLSLAYVWKRLAPNAAVDRDDAARRWMRVCGLEEVFSERQTCNRPPSGSKSWSRELGVMTSYYWQKASYIQNPDPVCYFKHIANCMATYIYYYACVSYSLIMRYFTSQLLCLLGYSGERSLGNIRLWGMLLGSSTAVVKLALLDHYLFLHSGTISSLGWLNV